MSAEDVLPGISNHHRVIRHEVLGEWLSDKFREADYEDPETPYCGECDGDWPDQHTEFCPVGIIIAMAHKVHQFDGTSEEA